MKRALVGAVLCVGVVLSLTGCGMVTDKMAAAATEQGNNGYGPEFTGKFMKSCTAGAEADSADYDLMASVCTCTLQRIEEDIPYEAAVKEGEALGSDFAYLTDCNQIPAESWGLLHNLDVVVLDALRERAHPTHFSLSEAVEAGRRIAAGRTYFTHMCHDLPHAATNARLPAGMELAYDGLALDADSQVP